MITIDDNYYKKLPKKRIGTGVLFFNEKKELLIVKPTYKPYWSIPGGIVDNNESPRQACVREVKEELDLDINIDKLLCVDYIFTFPKKYESLQFTFLGGKLNSKQIGNIKIPKKELEKYRFLEINKAIRLVSKHLAKRLPSCLKAMKENKTVYLENKYLFREIEIIK